MTRETRITKVGGGKGDGYIGVDFETYIESMKPGDLRIVKCSLFGGYALIRYAKDGEITIVDLKSGNEIYRG